MKKTDKKNMGRKRRIPSTEIEVKQDGKLLAYLLEHFGDKSRSEVKSYLAHRQIAVNGKMQTHFDFDVLRGDIISFRVVGEEKANPNHKVRIVYEDDFVLLVDKKCGVMSHSIKDDGVITAFSVMKEHVRKRGKENKLYTVHKLDRDTSGLLLFAKDEETQYHLVQAWRSAKIKRTHTAVVEGEMINKSGEIVSWLTENANSLKVFSSIKDNGGYMATTRYNTIKTNGRYTLVQVHLFSDYKHQVRVQLASIGHRVAGDKKYGAESNPLGRLCLHFNYIEFTHPYTRENMRFEIGYPLIFK